MPGPTVKPSSIKARAVKAPSAIKKIVKSSLPAPGGSLAAPLAIVQKWQALAGETTAGGQQVKSYLGFALQLVTFAGGAGQAVYFERGMIVLRPDKQVFAVYGMIYLRYRALGDVLPNGWSPGLPTSDEEPVPGGRCSHFDGADIYWSAATGAHEVHGAIRDRWTALGGCNGWVGYPITDESSVTHGGTEIGRMSQFQNASIYWSGASGAWELHGALRKAWLERFGGPSGPLGWPVSNETPSPAGTYRYNNFQHGCLVWRASDGFIQSFTSLDVYVDRFSSQGEHTFGEHFGASIWLWVSSSIAASTGQSASPRFPASDNYGNPNASPQTSVLTIPVVRGDLVINTSFTGFDHSPVQGDQNLGTVTGRFTIDQLWAVGQPQSGWDSSNSFFVEFSIRNDTPADPADPHFRQDLWWSFENVGTAQLSRTQYSQTFVDVELGESGFFHPFDELFYDLAYQGIAAGGNCYGMCLEANDTLARRSVYSEPLGLVPDNAAAMNEINIKQGYQLGECVVNYVVGKFLSGGTHDPVRAFNESRAMYDAGDYPILSLTNAFIGGDGHAVRPYAWDQSNPNDWIISVANPNCPPSDGPDNDPQNVIHIDPHANTFTFHFSPSDTWTGGSWTGGRMFAMPFSVMCTEQQTPFWDVMLALLGLSFIVLGGDAQTLQISDDHGRTFYSPTLSGPPALWSDIAPDGPGRIPGMARVGLISSPPVPSVAGAVATGIKPSPVARLTGRTVDPSRIAKLPGLLLKAPAEVYQLPVVNPFGTPTEPIVEEPGRVSPVAAGIATTTTPAASGTAPAGTTGSVARAGVVANASMVQLTDVLKTTPRPGPPGQVTHHIAATAGESYRWGMRSAAASIVATVPAAAGAVDEVTVQQPGAADQAVSLTLAPGAVARQAQFELAGSTLVGEPQPNVFVLSEVALTPGQPFTAGLSSDGQSLVIHNPGPAVTFQLQMKAGGSTGAVAARPSVTVGAGQAARIQPASWSPADIPKTAVTMAVMTAPGGPVVQEINL